MYAVFANYTGDKVYRTNTKVLVTQPNIGNYGESIQILARSRGGRLVYKWVRGKYLYNVRVAWLPVHLRQFCGTSSLTKEGAEEFIRRTVLSERIKAVYV